MAECSSVAKFMPEKARRKLMSFTGNEHLNNVIYEETDVLVAERKLLQQRAESLEYLKIWATNEDQDLQNAITRLHEANEKVYQTSSLFNDSHAEYISQLSLILSETKETKALEKEAVKAAKKFDKAEAKVTKKRAAARNPGGATTFDKQKADREVAEAEGKMEETKTAREAAYAARDAKVLVLKNFKNTTIKKALLGLYEASLKRFSDSITHIQEELEVVRGIQDDMTELPAHMAAGGAAPIPEASNPTSEMMVITSPACAGSQAVLFALAEKGITYEVESVDLSAPPAWFRDNIADRATPALRHKGKTVAGSLSTQLRYIEAEFPAKPINPPGADDTAAFSVAVDLFAAVKAVETESRVALIPPAFTKLTAALIATEQFFTAQGANGPFVFGTAMGLPDVAFAASLGRLGAVEWATSYVRPDAMPRVAAFWAALEARPAWKTVAYTEEAMRGFIAGHFKQLRALSYLNVHWRAMANAAETARTDIEAGVAAAKVSEAVAVLADVAAKREEWARAVFDALPATASAAVNAAAASRGSVLSAIDDAKAAVAAWADDDAARAVADAALETAFAKINEAIAVFEEQVKPAIAAAWDHAAAARVLAAALDKDDLAATVSFAMAHLDQAHRARFLRCVHAAFGADEGKWNGISMAAKGTIAGEDWADLEKREFMQPFVASPAATPAVSPSAVAVHPTTDAVPAAVGKDVPPVAPAAPTVAAAGS